jgi:Tfp pilus assembly protein PilO
VVTAPVVAPTVAPATTDPKDEGSDKVAAVPAPAAPTLFQVPITVKTTGSYFEMEQFLNRIEGLKRSFLVTGFSLRAAESSATDVGVSDGDLQLEIQGRVFLSPAAAATATAAAAPAVTSPSTAPAAN